MDEATLPHQTLLGVDGFNFEENRGRWAVRYALGLSSYLDQNLLNEIEILDLIHDVTGEDKQIALRDPQTGDEYSKLQVSAWQLSPMAQSEYRNYRTIMIELLRTSNDPAGKFWKQP